MPSSHVILQYLGTTSCTGRRQMSWAQKLLLKMIIRVISCLFTVHLISGLRFLTSWAVNKHTYSSLMELVETPSNRRHLFTISCFMLTSGLINAQILIVFFQKIIGHGAVSVFCSYDFANIIANLTHFACDTVVFSFLIIRPIFKRLLAVLNVLEGIAPFTP